MYLLSFLLLFLFSKKHVLFGENVSGIVHRIIINCPIQESIKTFQFKRDIRWHPFSELKTL